MKQNEFDKLADRQLDLQRTAPGARDASGQTFNVGAAAGALIDLPAALSEANAALDCSGVRS